MSKLKSTPLRTGGGAPSEEGDGIGAEGESGGVAGEVGGGAFLGTEGTTTPEGGVARGASATRPSAPSPSQQDIYNHPVYETWSARFSA